jgi:hypothetical protein
MLHNNPHCGEKKRREAQTIFLCPEELKIVAAAKKQQGLELSLQGSATMNAASMPLRR